MSYFKKTLNILLIITFLLYYAVMSLFTHSHLVDGGSIAHAHFTFDIFTFFPSGKAENSDNTSHTHTNSSLMQIAYIELVSILFILFGVTFGIFLLRKLSYRFTYISRFPSSYIFSKFLGRAPPNLVLL